MKEQKADDPFQLIKKLWPPFQLIKKVMTHPHILPAFPPLVEIMNGPLHNSVLGSTRIMHLSLTE